MCTGDQEEDPQDERFLIFLFFFIIIFLKKISFHLVESNLLYKLWSLLSFPVSVSPFNLLQPFFVAPVHAFSILVWSIKNSNPLQ